MRKVGWIQYEGPQRYGDVEKLQQCIFEEKIKKLILDDCVICCEHFPVITLGRRSRDEHLYQSREWLLRQGIDVCEIVRGGSVTGHEPGQLVFYPVLDLGHFELDSVGYVGRLAQWMIQVCGDLGLVCCDQPTEPISHPEGTHLTGVWVGQQKIASIGIRVQNGITMHGVALNVNNDCSVFRYIAPCGIDSLQVTSIQRLTGVNYDLDQVKVKARKHFDLIFGVHTWLDNRQKPPVHPKIYGCLTKNMP